MNPFMVICLTAALVCRTGVDNEVEYFLQKEGVSKNTAQEFATKRQ
jgi:hypothetical protein